MIPVVRRLVAIAALAVPALVVGPREEAWAQTGDKPPSAWVDPFIGTVADGNTYPGAVVPWGMASAVPHTDPGAPPGYHKTGKEILGFGQVQISGAGCPDLGNILLAVTTAEPPDPGTTGDPADAPPRHRSRFSREQASPGYYAVDLDSFGVHAEATATTRATMYRLRFPEGKPATLVLDAGHALTPVVGSWVGVRSGSSAAPSADDGPLEIEAISRSGDFCGSGQKQTVYAVAHVSRPGRAAAWTQPDGTGPAGALAPATETLGIAPPPGASQPNGPYLATAAGRHAGANLALELAADRTALVKIGISYVSLDNARRNLDTEIPDWDFERVRAAAREAWDRELGVFQVEGGTDDQKTLFYTGVYHILIHPNVFDDVSGEYQGMHNTGVKTAKGYTRYTLFSLWDTFRGVHPFYTLFYPSRELDMVRSIVAMGSESGWLPIWELAGQETNVMVGDPAVPVIADAWVKGLRDFDAEEAFRLIKKQATEEPPAKARSKGRTGLNALLKHGYIPYPTPQIGTGKGVWGPVSTQLEYNFADWAAAQLAQGLGKTQDAASFLERSHAWRTLFDPQTRQIRPKLADGSWLTPFDPTQNCPTAPCTGEWGMGGPGYVEGSAWQYTFFVNHDVPQLIELMGGEAAFTERLQEAFDKKYYNLNNEPDMAYPYLFTFVPGEAWRTQRQVRHDLATAFDRKAIRLPGNDDTGQTSSVYVWGALGLYPVTPASTEYRLGSPLFDRVTIRLDPAGSPRTLTIEARNNSPENVYVQRVSWNGQPLTQAVIDHRQLVAGGTLLFEMGPRPAAWDGGAKPIRLLSRPSPAKAQEGGSAEIAVTAEGSGLTYQWLRNGEPIPDATNRRYRIENAQPETQDRYSCLVGTVFGRSTLKSPAVGITVEPDRTPPTLLDAARERDAVVLTFSKALDSGTASEASRYSPDGGARVISATPTRDRLSRIDNVVRLTISGAGPGWPSTVRVKGVRDASYLGNTVAAGTSTPVHDAGDGLLGHWTNQGATAWSGEIALDAGKGYDLRFEYYQAGGGSSAALRWRLPGLSSSGVVARRFLSSR